MEAPSINWGVMFAAAGGQAGGGDDALGTAHQIADEGDYSEPSAEQVAHNASRRDSAVNVLLRECPGLAAKNGVFVGSINDPDMVSQVYKDIVFGYDSKTGTLVVQPPKEEEPLCI